MTRYYGSRAGLAVIMAALMAAFGMVWWGALLMGGLIFGTFVVLSRSGRYLVQPEQGMNIMRRDERSQEINRQAGLNGFVALVLALGVLVLYFGATAHERVPVSLLAAALGLGVGAYLLTDVLQRRI